MELVAVGGGRDVAPLPLPSSERSSEAWSEGSAERAPVTAVVSFLTGELLVDEWSDPVAAEVDRLVGEARAVTAAAARFDARLAQAYVWGAAELAARSGDPSARRRTEWGARGMLAELAVALHLPEGTLARRLTRITMLAAFPGLQTAHTAGVVSAEHVAGVLDVFSGVVDTEVLARADAALADRAGGLTPPQLRAAARRWRARHVPRTVEQHARAVADRFVDVSPADADLCWLTALLPAAAALGVLHRIDDLAATLVGPDEDRTVPQLRADVLCDLLLSTDVASTDVPPATPRDPVPEHVPADLDPSDGTTADDPRTGVMPPGPTPPGPGLPSWVRGVVPQVVLTVPVLTLLGHGDQPAELEGFGPIDLDTARSLCANAATFTRVLTHPETGAVLSVGRDRYTVPADLRRAVSLRDATCRFPGCRRRAARCDIDHTTAWADGGRTDLDNLACLCRQHHRLKHEAGWQVTHHDGGILRWRSPLGRHYTTRPATTLWPPPPVGASPPRPPAPPPAASPRGYPDTPPF